ncbi:MULTISPECIES: hypothetical protein [unclassified Mesorhizobium]|uniref:hypothetical protein n=1 Tax=unclassified Mesorhizobium TaxID=325217 RepID=UPI00047BD55F
MTMAQQKCSPTPDHRWISWLSDGFGWFAIRKRAHLDIRDLSPHLLRDLGFLDGNDPFGRHG